MAKQAGPREAFALMGEGYAYVDVRSVPEYEQAHPEGAFNVPLMHMQPGPGGGPSTMMPNTRFLEVMKAGYTGLVDQFAGFGGAHDASGRVVEAGWKDAGLPTKSGEDAERGYEALKARA